MNNKAFTLSINFLVIMIIMIVIFSFGIYLFTSIFNEVVKTDTEIHEQELDRLNLLLDDGSLVTVLNPQQTFGKDPLRFPIGITNEGAGANASSFKIVIETQTGACSNYKFTPNDGSSPSCLSDIVHLPVDSDTTGFTIRNNERKYRLILIDPKHNDGFYTVKFHIERDTFSYGGTQMLWVTMP